MGHNSDQPPAVVDTLAMEQAYQDRLIAKRLPDWMGKLGVAASTDQGFPATALYEEQPGALHEAVKAHLVSRHRLAAELARVEGIERFTKPLLQRALHEGFATGGDVDGLFFRTWYSAASTHPGVSWGRHPLPEKDYYEIPLFEAALYNFTHAEAEKAEQPKGNCVVDGQGNTLGRPTAIEFARLCRQLDLGKAYQQHLDAALNASAGQTASGHSVTSSLQQLYRAGMLIDACKAKSEGVLSGAELDLVIKLCRDGTLDTLHEAKVVARQLKAFGCALQQIVVLDVLREGWLFDSSQRVLVYIPGDPEGAWSVSSNLEAFTRKVLGMRLRNAPYQHFFSRFVRRRDSQTFFAKVTEVLVDVADWATREMDQHMVEYPQPLFQHLASARIAQIKDDAAVIVTPVAEIDRKLQQAHRRRLIAEGWTLVGLAGLFIPAIGALLLAAMVWELLENVFQALEDWREGDTHAALDHVLDIARTVATIGVTAVVFRQASRAWNALDTLTPARLEAGNEKLWNGDLRPFHSLAPPVTAVVDDEGIYRLGQRCWVSMDGFYYEVTQHGSDDTWQLLARGGHAPLLRHNRAGAWRLWSEQPVAWNDRYQMFRRLEGPLRRLEDEQVDQVLTLHGLTADHLRALHVYAKAPEAELTDTANRFLIHKRVQDLLSGLRHGRPIDDPVLFAKVQQLPSAAGKLGPELADEVWAQRRELLRQVYDEQQIAEDAQSKALRRVFPRLHRLAAKQLLAMASDADREFLSTHGKVPFQLTQAARVRVLRIRIARACEALFIDTPQNLDVAKVVLRLLETVSNRDSRPGWRLFDGEQYKPLLVTDGGGRTFRLIHQDGQFSLEDALGITLSGPGELFEVMVNAFDRDELSALGLMRPYDHALRSLLAQQVSGQRQAMAQWLGKTQIGTGIVAPWRLDDGRVGYPLGGSLGAFVRPSTRPRALSARLRDLYPAYSDAQVEEWLTKLHIAQRQPEAELNLLEQQAALLTSCLRTWERQGLASGHRQARRRFRQAIMECWRELIPERSIAPDSSITVSWTYTCDALHELPELPVQISFPHVKTMALRALKLEQLPDRFLSAFPNLRSLEVTDNRLQRIPVTLALLPKLRVVDFTNNRISMDQAQTSTLGACTSLVYLNLSNNPLGRTFSVVGMSQLSELRLRNTRITSVPRGILLRPQLYALDVAGNAITQLPEGFLRSEVWTQGHVELTGNPLSIRQDPARQALWAIPDTSDVPYHLRWLDRLEGEQREAMAAIWANVDLISGSANFLLLLTSLTRAAEFTNPATFNYLFVRVFEMMESAVSSPELAKELFENALVQNCADNATVVFADLEVRALVWQATHDTTSAERGPALVKLARRLWRLEQVKYLAWVHASRTEIGRRESLEVALVYCLALREDLDLPINFRSMRFADIVDVQPDDIARAKRQVLSSELPETLAVWMLERSFWQTYIADTYAERLQLPESFHQRLQALMERGASEAQIDQLGMETDQWSYQRKFQLTLDALNAWP